MFSKSTIFGLLCVAIVLFGGCASGPAWTPESTPLIERSQIFGNPDKAGATISPDGSMIAYLAPVDGVLNVWVGPANDPASAKAVTQDTDRGIRIYFWAKSGKQLLYLQDKGGDENWRVYAVDLDSGEVKDLTPYDNVQARVENVSHLHPEEILVGLNNRNPQVHDIHRINILTGESELVQQNDEGYAGYVTDDDYQVRFASAFTPNGGSAVFWGYFDDASDFQGQGSVAFMEPGTAFILRMDVAGELMDLWVNDVLVLEDILLNRRDGWIGLTSFGGPVTFEDLKVEIVE